jgi:hypothetical protein
MARAGLLAGPDSWYRPDGTLGLRAAGPAGPDPVTGPLARAVEALARTVEGLAGVTADRAPAGPDAGREPDREADLRTAQAYGLGLREGQARLAAAVIPAAAGDRDALDRIAALLRGEGLNLDEGEDANQVLIDVIYDLVGQTGRVTDPAAGDLEPAGDAPED